MLHTTQLKEMLVEMEFLDEADVDIDARVSEAVDDMAAFFADNDEYDDYYFPKIGSGYFKSRRPMYDTPGTVRIKMTAELVDYLVAFAVHNEYARINDSRHGADTDFLDLPSGVTLRAFPDYRDFEKRQREHVGFLDVPPEFAERLRESRGALRQVAEQWLSYKYLSFTHDPPPVPCRCEARLPECECMSRFIFGLDVVGEMGRHAAPRPRRPIPEKPLSRKDLLPNKVGGWWRNPRYDDDPIVRSHKGTASAGMKGFDAAAKGGWRSSNPEQDDRPSTRDANRTAREGEKELEKPYDNPRGTPKSWANRSDAEPENDLEDGTITPPKEEEEQG